MILYHGVTCITGVACIILYNCELWISHETKNLWISAGHHRNKSHSFLSFKNNNCEEYNINFFVDVTWGVFHFDASHPILR